MALQLGKTARLDTSAVQRNCVFIRKQQINPRFGWVKHPKRKLGKYHDAKNH